MDWIRDKPIRKQPREYEIKRKMGIKAIQCKLRKDVETKAKREENYFFSFLYYMYLYNNQVNAWAPIGQLAVDYCASKPTEKSRVFWIII